MDSGDQMAWHPQDRAFSDRVILSPHRSKAGLVPADSHAMSVHSRALRGLPVDIQGYIQEFASDRVTCRAHEAALISALAFRPSKGRYHKGTVVETPPGVHFIQPSWHPWRRAREGRQMRIMAGQYDEHNYPQHFGIDKIWPTLREQDETEAMGAEDTRLYPQGCDASAQPHAWGWL